MQRTYAFYKRRQLFFQSLAPFQLVSERSEVCLFTPAEELGCLLRHFCMHDVFVLERDVHLAIEREAYLDIAEFILFREDMNFYLFFAREHDWLLVEAMRIDGREDRRFQLRMNDRSTGGE